MNCREHLRIMALSSITAISLWIHWVDINTQQHRISSINTVFSISTPVQYYLNTNNIDIVVIFISSTPLNSIAYHFAILGNTANYRASMIISLIVIEL